VALWNECDPKETGGVIETVYKVEARGSRHPVRGAGEANGDKVVTKPSSIGCPEDLDITPCSYSHLSYDKGAQYEGWRKDSLFNKWCWEN
jgi:hypothetical protein